MIKYFVKIVLICMWILPSHNAFSKPGEHKLNMVSKDNKLVINKKKQNYTQVREGIKAKGTKSYFSQDTLYIISKKDSLVIKRYIKLSENNRKVELKYAIEQERKGNYLFVNLYYFGDAMPFKSFLIDLRFKKIIIENESYQFYLGYSDNELYHLFEGGTSASVRDFAIFDSDNKLLLESSYYPEVKDTNQLKWMGNKVYYYSNSQKDYALPPDNNKESKGLFLIYVQKYMWEENNNYILNEFKEAYIE